MFRRSYNLSIILFKINKNSIIDFYYAILALCLTVALRVKCDKKLLFDVKEITKQDQNLKMNNNL